MTTESVNVRYLHYDPKTEETVFAVSKQHAFAPAETAGIMERALRHELSEDAWAAYKARAEA